MKITLCMLLTLCAAPCITLSQVAPINPGENLWLILNRINTEETSIFDTLSSIGCDSDCTFTIGPANIPYTITQSGTYCLISDLSVTFTTDPVITVTATSGVTIEMNDYVISGTTGVFGTLITTSTDVIIRNGALEGCSAGIAALFSSDVQFSNLTFTGDPVNTQFSIGALFSSNIAIKNVIMEFGVVGISLSDSDGCSVHNCTITDITFSGILIGGSSSYNIISQTTVNNSSTYGFNISSTPTTTHPASNILVNCIASNCLNTGILLASIGSNGCITSQCQTSSCGVGMQASGSSDPQAFLECFASNNNNNGFSSQGNNMITGSSLLNNGSVGINNIGGNSYTDVLVQNNIARFNTLGNYVNVYISTIETLIDTTTGFWANISS